MKNCEEKLEDFLWDEFLIHDNIDPSYGFRHGWKAALDWALTLRTSGIEEDGTISKSDIIFGRKIEEELKDEI